MDIEKITTFCFSPTGTSRKNMMAVLSGLEEKECQHVDVTYDTPSQMKTLNGEDLAVFSVPVYGGHVPPVALQRLDKVRGERTPAILLVTYGNRDYEKALNQLEDFVCERGFLPVAAAAMIGEHSYSNAQNPIAVGRPDAADLASAKEFGAKLWAEKLSHWAMLEFSFAEYSWGISTRKMPKVKTPWLNMLRFVWFVLGYQRRQKKNPVKIYPSAPADECTHCGNCVGLCPTQAIAVGKEEVTDPARCIRCCACVKGCPSGVRTFDSPFAAPLSKNFQMRRELLYIY